VKKLLKNFLIVSRANIQIASLPTAALGVALAAKNWTDIFNLSVILYIILFFVILTYSCNINCLNDLEVDEKHKYYLSNAVKSIGIPKLKILMTTELIIAGIIIISLCILKKEIIYLLAFLGITCGYIYSAPPLRIKKRGILSPLPVTFGLYFLPIIAGWFIITNQISIFIILFGMGYALIMQGITFINTCEDYKEDRISGIRTFAHVLGIRKTLLFGSILVFIGGVADLVLLLFYKINLHNIKTTPSILALMLIIFFLGSIINISKNLYLVGISKDPFALSKKEAAKMRIWFLTTRYPLLFISLLLIS
jgi:4-hydroxybenzoate polyprenyltransferase